MPALAQTQPLRVSTISTPRSARTTRAALAQDQLDQARVLAQPGGQLARPLRRARRRRGRAPGPRPSRRPSARRRPRRRPTAPRPRWPAPRRSARRGARRSRSRAGRRTGTISTPGLIRAARPPSRSPSRQRGRRRRGAGRLALERLGQRGEVVGRVEVEGQRVEPLDRDLVTGRARAVGVAGAAVRARRPGRSRRAAQSSSALVPVPWRSGTTVTRPLAHPLERRVELGRVEQRAVAGQQGDALGAERLGPDDPERRRLRVAAVLGVAQDLERRRRRAARGAARSARRAPRR